MTLNADASGALSGRVEGASGGIVELYRETPSARIPVANAELGPDGSYSLQDAPPGSPTLYRAVFVDPSTQIPYAALLRTPVG